MKTVYPPQTKFAGGIINVSKGFKGSTRGPVQNTQVFCEKVDFEKNQQTTNKHAKLTSMQSNKVPKTYQYFVCGQLLLMTSEIYVSVSLHATPFPMANISHLKVYE